MNAGMFGTQTGDRRPARRVAGPVRLEGFGAWLSLARAPGSGPGGRWFESTRPDQIPSLKSAICEFWPVRVRVRRQRVKQV